MLDKLLGLIAPHVCIVCESEGSLLCAWCAPEAFETIPERCYRCYVLSKGHKTCKACRRSTPLHTVWVVTAYSGPAKELIKRFKFERSIAAQHIIAAEMSSTLPFINDKTIITYVPTAPKRIRIRGYDQSKLLAQSIAKGRGYQCTPLFNRLGSERQLGATKKQRTQQAQKSYTIRKGSPVKGQDVLIVDDILTTGATLEATAQLLKKAGAKSVTALVFAHKV